MGLLERFRPTAETTWHPPALGTCRCDSHVDDLLDVAIPTTDGKVGYVSDLMLEGALKTAPSIGDQLYLFGAATNERRGPFHWWVEPGRRLARFVDLDAPVRLDDSLFVQPGIERVLTLDDQRIAIGAPKLCRRGVQAMLVNALLNPRVRRDGGPQVIG